MNSDQRRDRAQPGAVIQALQREGAGEGRGAEIPGKRSKHAAGRFGSQGKGSGLRQRSVQYVKFPEHHHQFAAVRAHSGAQRTEQPVGDDS